MKRTDILHGIEIVIFKHPRRKWHYDLLDRLMDAGYIDWYGWYDEKEQRHKHQINATQKGLMYYANQRGKRVSKFYFVLTTIILVIPYVAILLSL
jgi:hypothetical protein